MRWLVASALLLAVPAHAASFSDGGNTFLSYDCSTSGTYSPNCAEYPFYQQNGVTALGVVNAQGGFDVEYFNEGTFGGFFAEDLLIPDAATLYAIQLPELIGSASIEYGIGISQAERYHGDPWWATILFDVSWNGSGWFIRTVYNGNSAPTIVGDRVYFWSASYPTGAGSTFGTVFGGRSSAPFSALGLALVPEPGLAALAFVACASLLVRHRSA